MAEQVNLSIQHAHLFTMSGPGVGYISDGAVTVRRSQIVAVGPTDELGVRSGAVEILDATDCAVLPESFDAHMHMCQGWQAAGLHRR